MWGWIGHWYQRRLEAKPNSWVWGLQWEGDVALLQCLPLPQQRS